MAKNNPELIFAAIAAAKEPPDKEEQAALISALVYKLNVPVLPTDSPEEQLVMIENMVIARLRLGLSAARPKEI
jgi:hypothetical protein